MPDAAFIFDMDGTMLNNMSYHQRAWQKIVDELKGGLQGKALQEQLYGKNEEVLRRIFGKQKFNEEQLKEISNRKEQYYRDLYFPHMKLVPGLEQFLSEAARMNVSMALATASGNINTNLLLDKLKIRPYFKAIITADDVQMSKPDPETFLKAAEKLGVPPPCAIVFEDVPKGVEAAANAKMKAVLITTQHKPEAFSGFNNIIAMVPDFTEIRPSDMLKFIKP